jgi:pimeloyl-ACP methyl ester carboxylesterase
VLPRVGDDVVLVGHSYAGAVVTHATGPAHDIAGNVAHLVYVAAFALDDGESVSGFNRANGRLPVALDEAVVVGDDGCSRLDPDAAPAALYGSCPPAAVRAAVARLDAQPLESFRQTVTGSPRQSIASTYVRCTLDQAVHIDRQAEMAARCRTVVTLECDHSPFLAMPEAVAEILEPLAKA